jgi:hypothetical protein
MKSMTGESGGPVLRRGKRRIANAVICVYGAWLLPAGLGAILGWPWWLGIGLLIPASSWYFGREGVRYYRCVQNSDPHAALVKRVPALGMLPLVFVTVAWPSRFSALFVVSGLIFQDLWFYARLRSDI